MKKTILNISITAFLAASIFTACQSPAEKVDSAKADVKEAKQDLKAEQKDANAEAAKKAEAEEWRVYKLETEARIKDNDVRIAELRVRLKKPGKVLDPLYAKQIEGLEKRNRALQAKIDAYVPEQSTWESFKSESKHDMDELGHSLKDFTVDNKK
jgi:chromosome segregation ATPase